MVIGYAHVSTEDQNTEGQLPELRKAGCKRIYQEKVSGASPERPEVEKCLERLDKGDTLVVWRLDRLGRSIRDLLRIVSKITIALPITPGQDCRHFYAELLRPLR